MSMLAPAFLAGLLAVVLPWWLHRLSRDNPPLQDFGSSMFLQAGETMSSQQTRLRYKKLFALRFLLLALLALLFAEPAMKFTRLLAGSDYRQILIVDTSMSQKLGDRWARTNELARQKLDTVSASDEIYLISASHQIVQADGDNTVSAAREQLAQLSPGLSRLDYGQLASAITDLVEDSSLPVQVHLFTDLQASAMPARLSDLTFDGIEVFEIHSSASSDDSNLFVSGQLNHSANGKADITVIASNYGEESRQATLQLTAAGATLAQSEITIEANSNKVQRFPAIDTSAATDGAIEIRIEPGDQLNEDNSWLIALPDGSRSDVSLLQSNALANRYAKAAIESDPRYVARSLTGENLSASVAGGLLVIADASAMTDRATNKLKQYLDDGGNALIIVGADPHSVPMRNLLNVRSASVKQSANAASNQDGSAVLRPQVIGRVDNTHPLTSDTINNWRAISVLRHLPLDLAEGDKTIIALGDHSPLLIERKIGDGTVLVLASALKSSWNNLAVNPLFVAFVIGAIEHLSGVDNTATYRTVGETITIAPGAQLLDPGGEPLRGLTDINRKGRVTLDERGIYTLRSGNGSAALSVNTDARESDARQIDGGTLQQWQSAATGAANIVDNNSDSTAPVNEVQSENPVERDQLKSLWQWLLPLLAILVLVESLYGHRHLWIKREA